jgi:hypothetical protein
MLGKNNFRKLVTLTTAFTVWTVYSMVALAVPPRALVGEITVTGQVTVNGQPAISSSTVLSGSTIVTSADSSAVINLGKAGRVELGSDSSVTLKFTDDSIVGMVSQGKVRVSTAAGIATTFTSKDATVIADASQADSFGMEVECSHTHIDTTAGVVTMREGSNDKQVVAGTTAVAGNLSQTGCKPCLRPNSAPPIPIGGPWWLLLAAAGVAGFAILIGEHHEDTNPGGNVIVVSPVRG